MKDALASAERHLIDARVAAGDVTRTTPSEPLLSGRRPDPAVAARRLRVLRLADGTMTARQIARELDLRTTTVNADLTFLRKAGETPATARATTRTRHDGRDKAALKKEASAAARVSKVADRRRFRTVPVPMGRPANTAPADAAGTIFPLRVFDPIDGEAVLKDGSSNAKIGGDVLVGWLEGARIVTLTLEERATCPQSCPLWRGCYGNSMQHPRRWRHGPKLERRIEREVADLCAAHGRVLVRLHVLGDFYSSAYVQLWATLLLRHQGLNLFGFTAWGEATEIGREVADLRSVAPGRVFIRHSGRTGPWGSFTIDFPTEKKQIGDAVVCPEQREAMNGTGAGRHCGDCAVCWSCDAPIVFVEH